MAETILFSLASKILGKISSGAVGEVGKAWGVEQELNTLEGTLSTIKAVLLDADRLYDRGVLPNAMGVWFDRLQAALYDADNLLDELHYEDLRRQLVFSFDFPFKFKFKFKIGSRIENIRKRLDKIADDKKFHPIVTTTTPQHNDASTSLSSNVNESEFVGRVNDRLTLLKLIMAPSVHNDENMFVLPIVGIAGIGKTALVKFLYNHEMVAELFQLRIWVKVALSLSVKELMQKIIRCITDSPPSADLNSDQLKNLLQEKLHNTKFLLVLDDLCYCDNRDWHKLYDLLRCGGIMGSKIIMTTRYLRVATIVGTVPTYNLESLSDKDCLELLWKWAGCREKLGEEHVNAKLSEIAKEIVKKCHGCPRAAKTLGNNLFMETDESKWLELKEKQLWELPQKKRDILVVLRSSYGTQSTELKRCFIYCSIFPKSYEIEIDKLIQLWMAQGLIQSSGLTSELEDTGTDYLNQLCSIFFLEKTEEQHGNLSNTCRMPEIIHDLAVYMANEECLITTNYRFGPISDKVKHISFHDFDCSGKEVTKALFELKNLRTVFFPFQGLGASDTGFVNRCISKFKYLYVLDLSNSCFQVLPHSIGNLKHLRFFDISGNTNLETLPNAICKLFNLQTLRIWYCLKIRKLPKNIGNLICLRHLYLTTQQSRLSERQIQRLTSLQSFRITGCGNLKSLPKGMRLLIKLKTVTIAACPKLISLPSTMKSLPKLRNLEISNCPNLDLAGWEEFSGLRRIQ